MTYCNAVAPELERSQVSSGKSVQPLEPREIGRRIDAAVSVDQREPVERWTCRRTRDRGPAGGRRVGTGNSATTPRGWRDEHAIDRRRAVRELDKWRPGPVLGEHRGDARRQQRERATCACVRPPAPRSRSRPGRRGTSGRKMPRRAVRAGRGRAGRARGETNRRSRSKPSDVSNASDQQQQVDDRPAVTARARAGRRSRAAQAVSAGKEVALLGGARRELVAVQPVAGRRRRDSSAGVALNAAISSGARSPTRFVRAQVRDARTAAQMTRGEHGAGRR